MKYTGWRVRMTSTSTAKLRAQVTSGPPASRTARQGSSFPSKNCYPSVVVPRQSPVITAEAPVISSNPLACPRNETVLDYTDGPRCALRISCASWNHHALSVAGGRSWPAARHGRTAAVLRRAMQGRRWRTGLAALSNRPGWRRAAPHATSCAA